MNPIPDVVVDNFDVVVEDVVVVVEVDDEVEVDDDDIDDNVDDSVISVPAGRGVGAANLPSDLWFTLR